MSNFVATGSGSQAASNEVEKTEQGQSTDGSSAQTGQGQAKTLAQMQADANGEGSQTAQSQKKPEARPAAPEVYEIKIDGQVVRMTLDEMKKEASLARSSSKRFEEASKLKKQSEAFIEKMRKDPLGALSDPSLGLSKDEIRVKLEEFYDRQYLEDERLTPEQKKIRDYEEKLKTYEEKDKEDKANAEREQQEKFDLHQRETLQKDIIEAIDSSKLPKTRHTVQRIAYWMSRNLANGWNAPMDVIVAQVNNERRELMSDMLDASDGEVLVKLLGDGVVEKLTAYRLKKLREKRGLPDPTTQTREEQIPEPKTRDEATDWSEVNRRIRAMRPKPIGHR